MKEKNSQFLWNNSINLVIGGSGLLSKRPTRYNSSNWPSYYIEAKGIRIKAVNRKTCPSWHAGNGGDAWVFADEIVIE